MITRPAAVEDGASAVIVTLFCVAETGRSGIIVALPSDHEAGGSGVMITRRADVESGASGVIRTGGSGVIVTGKSAACGGSPYSRLKALPGGKKLSDGIFPKAHRFSVSIQIWERGRFEGVDRAFIED